MGERHPEMSDSLIRFDMMVIFFMSLNVDTKASILDSLAFWVGFCRNFTSDA